MRLCSPEQPYPGLRPFEPQEAEYFCGRKREIHRLEGMIQGQRFVAVLGSSGAGKSSLVLAGVLPRLTEERLSTGESAWQALRMRPGGAPFRALAEKAAELACRLHPEQAVSSMVLRDRALGLLRRGSQGLQQVAVELGLTSGVHLLLIVDQFEELFRYKGIDRRQTRREDEEPRDRSDEAAAFAAELLAAREDGAQPVHVVITMRSDFVGEAARFRGLPEAIDAGQFLVPRMSRAQMEAAIREPLGLAGVTISPGFVQRLLNDTGTEPDALPVMQHVLLRTWEEARAEATAPAAGEDRREIPAPDTSGRKLLPRHYEAAGTIAHALSQHANAILDQLGKEDRELPEAARWLFRALSEVDKEGRAVRRPQRYAELVVLMGSRRRKQVRRVLDRFRDDDCHFLTPFISAFPRLKADTVIDVTHEALLRNWDKLRNDVGKIGWLAEEFEDGLIWRSLAVEAEMFVKDPRCTLGPVTAKRQEKWIAGLPSPYWVRRHAHPSNDTAAGPKQDEGSHEWHQVSRLITASSQAADRQERWRQIRLWSLVVLVVILSVVIESLYWTAVRGLPLEVLWERWVYMLVKPLPLPDLVPIPARSFTMGSPKNEEGRDSNEEPQRQVTIEPFEMGKNEVTFLEWDACIADGDCNGYRPEDENWGRGRRPVINVSWEDAKAYVTWLSSKTGKTCRLPSEAEWEYAARADTTTKFALPAPAGSNDIAKGLANCKDCEGRWRQQTAPVGSFPANAFGVRDMHGNVFEWIEDCWHNSYAGAPKDGRAWDKSGDCSFRMLRSGSWFFDQNYARSASRGHLNTNVRNYDLGFRVVCSSPSSGSDR